MKYGTLVKQQDEVITINQPPAVGGTGTSLGPALPERIKAVQDMTGAGPSRAARRLLIIWFRIFVWEESSNGKVSRVNVRIPIPIPFIGAFLPRKLSAARAMKMLSDLERLPESDYAPLLESAMAFEFIRVEEHKPHKRELVVLGFD